MDTLWNLEEKWKISTQKAVTLLVCTLVLVILLCTIIILMILKNKAAQRNKIASLNLDSDDDIESLMITDSDDDQEGQNASKKCHLYVKSVLVGSGCWSMAHKWNNNNELMLNCWHFSGCVGSKLRPVWQRPILMGEKCELPKFSGLILYDERGRPLPNHGHSQQCHANSHIQVDESLKVEEVEVFYDPSELFGGLLKGQPLTTDDNDASNDPTTSARSGSGCPLGH